MRFSSSGPCDKQAVTAKWKPHRFYLNHTNLLGKIFFKMLPRYSEGFYGAKT